MNCLDCQAKICDLTADALPAPDADSVREHLNVCATCGQEMQLLQYTLFSVSCLTQSLPSPLASEQMWHHCSEHIFQKVEAERGKTRHSVSANSTSGLSGWLSRQPRWSWATLGGAVAILGSVWLLAPHEEAQTFANNDDFPAQNDSPGQLVSLRRPSGAATGLVNHHSAMAVDPFTDYVGTTLVSYSATSPQR